MLISEDPGISSFVGNFHAETHIQPSHNRTTEQPPFPFPYPIPPLFQTFPLTAMLTFAVAIVLTLDLLSASFYSLLDTVFLDATLERLAFRQLFLFWRA